MKTAETTLLDYSEKITRENIELPVVEFRTGNTLVIDKERNELRLLNRDQKVQLIISVNNDELMLTINAQQLNINAANEINLSAKKINIEAAEQVNIKSGGNLVQQIEKDSLTEVGGNNKMIAAVQKITASLGNIELKANDDVRLNGERVKLNCD